MINEHGEFIREKAAPPRHVEVEAVNLDVLQQEAQKLLKLLSDRQPGLGTWNQLLRERLQNLHKLSGQALGNK